MKDAKSNADKFGKARIEVACVTLVRPAVHDIMV